MENDMPCNNLLKKIFLNHTEKVSDKWTFYIEEWDRIFGSFRDLPINLFEIGIQNGGSLEIWAKYFANARKIVGCDIDEKCKELSFADPRIELHVGDANTDAIQEKVLESAANYDIIIDDGSHKSSDVIISFSRYFPCLVNDGVYVVEDLHTSYWQAYEGGLFNPNSSMSFFKHLADIINHEHWRNNQSRVSFLSAFSDSLHISFTEGDLLSIHSIEFINSVCILKKGRPDENVLGKRNVVGTNEIVTEGLKKLNDTFIHNFSAVIKDDSDLSVWNLVTKLEVADHSKGLLTQDLGEKMQTIAILEEGVEEERRVNSVLSKELEQRDRALEKLTTDLSQHDQVLEKLQIELSESQKEVVQYTQSTSWKLTRPFRKIGKYLKGNRGGEDNT